MSVIWKFPIFNGFTPTSLVEMPAGAEILALQLDAGDTKLWPAVWATVDPDAPKVQRRFVNVGTGRPAPEDGVYVGTWQKLAHDGANYVFHVFEVPLS
jgi:hypothetical protein